MPSFRKKQIKKTKTAHIAAAAAPRTERSLLSNGFFSVRKEKSGEKEKRKYGAGRDRTDDLLRARQALSQLSYGPITGKKTKGKRELPHPPSLKLRRDSAHHTSR